MRVIDPNIARKNALQNAHLRRAKNLPDGSPVFSHVEFSISGLCNRKCEFCPRADPTVYPNVNEYMSFLLYRKILEYLREINYTGRLSYSGFGEPLFHNEIVKFVSLSKEMIPNCILEILTNGDMLNSAILRSLFDAGLNTLLISMYDGPEQITYFKSLVSEAALNPEQVILRKRYLSPEDHFGIVLSNRAGMVNIRQLNVKALTEPMNNPCYYPHYRMIIDHNGDVPLCPHDWGKKLIIGNLNDEHVVDIWTGERMTHFRKRLSKGDRHFAPCNVCDVLGTLQGSEHFKAWQTFYDNKMIEG